MPSSLFLDHTFQIQLKGNASCKKCFSESLAKFDKQTTHDQFESHMCLGGEKKSDTNENLRSLQPREENK